MGKTDICGNWKKESTEKFDEFLQAQDVGWMIRQAAKAFSYGAGTDTMTISIDGDNIKIDFVSKASGCNQGVVGKGKGENPEGKAPNGDALIIVMNWNGDNLQMEGHDKAGKKKVVIEEYFMEGDKLIKTLTVGDVVAREVYVKV
ncbi:hypothetical protein CYMTET_17496 [Cymbomonas tetramitiformis]|uniref:Uncharacterized protein n=1 Tax=Cymbomonas tetramitiformis TaxID=36881 RepID=A0AAE0G9T5_9CHLO|nr:hypothetical protein CYMTET_17496 [Cymbomonas tetramitiformis]